MMENSDVEVNEPQHGSASRSTTPVSSTAIKGKKRKRTNGEVMEALVSKVMKMVTEISKESDNTVVYDTKIYRKLKNKSCLSIEKMIIVRNFFHLEKIGFSGLV